MTDRYRLVTTDEVSRGLLRVARQHLRDLGVSPGAPVAVTGQRMTHARLMPAPVPAQELRADELTAANAGAAPGQDVTVHAAELGSLSGLVLRVENGVAAAPSDLQDAMFDMAVTSGDAFEIHLPNGRCASIRVLSCDPAPAGLVSEATSIVIESAPKGDLGYDELGGLHDQIAQVHEMIAAPLMRPELFATLGMTAPRGVLFVGPPGSGKTLLARAVANKTKASFFQIDAPEIVSKHYGDSEAALRRVFEAAAKAQPAIVFIDEIDAIAPRRESLSTDKQVERRLVAQLLTIMDGMADRGRIVVMAATNLPNSLDPALRRPGRFDREVVFTPPKPSERRAILEVHLRDTPLDSDVDLSAIADASHGFLGADLAALVREAAMAALRRTVAEAGDEASVDVSRLRIAQRDLSTALDQMRPSALRGSDTPVAPLRLEDVGGMSRVKDALHREILLPLQHRNLLDDLGLKPARGVLLSGPPGTGKTLLARAIAGQGGMNFVAVRPPELLSQYLGEAEGRVATLFANARQSAPTLLFFDEFDALAPSRTQGQDAAQGRIVAQLLVEVDGIGGDDGVVLLAATNRPDAIDPALLRPGRFDAVFEVSMPDAVDREEILRLHLAQRAVEDDIDVPQLVQATDGMSGADIAALTASAARVALHRAVAAQMSPVAVCADDLSQALRAFRSAAELRSSNYIGRRDVDGSSH